MVYSKHDFGGPGPERHLDVPLSFNANTVRSRGFPQLLWLSVFLHGRNRRQRQSCESVYSLPISLPQTAGHLEAGAYRLGVGLEALGLVIG